jgi:hypothetical protein
VREILYVRRSVDCVDDPGDQVATYRQVKGSRALLRAAAGDPEGEPPPHWPWTLLLNIFQSLAVGLGCVVLIFMAGQRLT